MRKALALALVVVATLATGRQPDQEPPGETYIYVWKVLVGQDNYLYINPWRNFNASQIQKTGGCNNPWWARSKYPLTDERTKAQMRIALASLITRLPVFVSTQGCTGDGRLILVGLQVETDTI